MLLSKFLIGDLTKTFAAINVVACVGWVQLIPCLQLNYCILLIMGLYHLGLVVLLLLFVPFW